MARRDKIVAVIAAICRDLGLVPGVVSQQHRSVVHDAIITFGANFVGLIADALFRIQDCVAGAVSEPLTPAAIDRLHHAILVSAGSP